MTVAQGRDAVIVPTLGQSPHLEACLQALRVSGGQALERILVAPQSVLDQPELAGPRALADRVVALERNLGFAGNNNLALEQVSGERVALVNDDAIVEAGWWPRLSEALDRHGDVAAVQGLVVSLHDGSRIDGWGMGWNRHWQAIQLGHGVPVEEAPSAPCELFGVSATAAVFRRSVLTAIAEGDCQPFDPSFFAYYEDVELAIRLRRAGWRAWLVPEARAAHAGSLTGEALTGEAQARGPLTVGKGELLVGNRWWVLMGLLGRGLWSRLPAIVGRDLRDVGGAMVRGEGATVRAYLAGWRRALGQVPQRLHWGPPRLPISELRRFQGETRYHRPR